MTRKRPKQTSRVKRENNPLQEDECGLPDEGDDIQDLHSASMNYPWSKPQHNLNSNNMPGAMVSQAPPSRAVSTATMMPHHRDNKIGPIVKKEHAIVLRKNRKRRNSDASSVGLFEGKQVNPSWIRENLHMRECIRYTEAPPNPKNKGKPEDPKCQCGKRKKKHEDRFLQNPDPSAKWKVDTHTHTSACNAYGEIEFIGAVGGGVVQKPRKYVRVEHATSTTKLLQLFSEVWNLNTPKLLISVTGGARNFPLNHRLKDVFRKGLIKAATSTGAWIITGGTHAGVMKYVGEAVRDHNLANGRSNVVAVGIASWGVIAHREKLTHDEGRFPAYYKMDTKKGILLDPNHTHFVLVDNGTIDQFGVEIKLRGRLEKAISEQKISKMGDKAKDVSVPIVIVVVEGGPNTIQTTYEAIVNDTPAVVVAGSGRAADILSYAFQHTKEYKTKDAVTGKEIVRNVMPEAVKVQVAEMISKEFGEKELDVHLNRIEACIQHRHLITVYELGASTTMDIDGAILHALLKANKGRIQDQLRLALVWNRVDVAKREIFTDDKEWGKGELNEALHYALVNNQVNFIELFLEQGVNLKDYLTIKELTLLYNEIRSNTLIYELLEKQRGRNALKNNLGHVARVIRDLTFDTFEPLYMGDFGRYILCDDEISRLVPEKVGDAEETDSDEESGMEEDDHDEMETGATPRVGPYSIEGGLTAGKHMVMSTSLIACPPAIRERGKRTLILSQDGGPDIQSNLFERPMRELFVFSILQNRHDMAKLFWEECRESIAAALSASKLLKGMADKEDDSDQSENMKKHADHYEELAIGVLNECYEEDEERSALILVCELPFWGNSTCLNIAVNAENMLFISHSGVQNLLNQIWLGKISDETSSMNLWLCSLCPLFIFCLIKFREDEGDEEEEKDAVKRKVSQKKKKKEIPTSRDEDEVFANEDPMSKSLQMVSIHPPNSPNTSQSQLIDGKNGNALGPKKEEKEEDTFSLMNAKLDIRDSGNDLFWWQRLKYFYDAPMITFRHNVISYLLFLALYSYIVVANFHVDISVYEIVLIMWVASLFTEEFRQIAQGESSSWRIKLYSWFNDYWNLIDMATLTLFTVGTVLRFYPSLLAEGRIILSINLAIFYIRLLHIFSVNKQLGPKLIMIQRMMVDLLFFLCILMVFLFGYGIASQAILFPNETSGSLIVRGIFMRPYFQIFGELFLEVIEGVDCSTNATEIDGISTHPCPEYSWMGVTLLGFYMMISNVLLLNLLIAMFSYTFSAIQDNTDIYWKFQRYELIKEYFNRPPLIPPFIFISHFFYLMRFILQHCFSTCGSWQIPELKQSLNPHEKKMLILWEGINSDNYVAKERIRGQQDLNERVKLAGERVESMTVKLDQVFEEADDGTGKGGGLFGGKGLEERLCRLEDRMERTNDALDWIITALSQSGNLGVKASPPKLKEIKGKNDSIDIETEERKHEVPVTIEALGIMIHQKSRASPYPGTAIRRFMVPDDKVPWDTDFPSYHPVSYTHKSVCDMPHWADIDLVAMPKNERPILLYNQDDTKCRYNRKSYMGSYQVKDGLPQNPKGRTGMTGRGLLGRFGPNHAADPIVTRWKRMHEGNVMMDGEKKVLEFIAIQRVDNQQWAIPGGMVEPGDVVTATLKREFGEEALGAMNKSEEEQQAIMEQVDKLFNQGKEVYKGYVDDPRNTDNAWMETVAMNFHDEDGSAFGSFTLEASDDAQSVRWQRVSPRIRLFASHSAMLRKVAELHGAAFD